MSNSIVENILRPLSTRVGTALATWIAAQGINYSYAENIALGIVAIGLVSADLVGSYFSRKMAKD